MSELTNRQREILDWIVVYIDQWGYPPTVRDIQDGFGMESPNGVMCHLKALEKKDAIRRTPKIPRSIVLLEN